MIYFFNDMHCTVPNMCVYVGYMDYMDALYFVFSCAMIHAWLVFSMVEDSDEMIIVDPYHIMEFMMNEINKIYMR